MHIIGVCKAFDIFALNVACKIPVHVGDEMLHVQTPSDYLNAPNNSTQPKGFSKPLSLAVELLQLEDEQLQQTY